VREESISLFLNGQKFWHTRRVSLIQLMIEHFLGRFAEPAVTDKVEFSRKYLRDGPIRTRENLSVRVRTRAESRGVNEHSGE
jgi:hypothetical protein